MTRLHPRSAATLVDMIIVVLITGILAAVGAPRFATTISSLRSRAVAQRIAGDLNYARRSAMLTSTEVEVAFELSPARYRLENVDDPFRPGREFVVALASIDGSANLVSVDFAGDDTIIYNAYGIPQALAGSDTSGSSATAAVVVVAVASAQTAIIIDPATGEARVP